MRTAVLSRRFNPRRTITVRLRLKAGSALHFIIF